MDKITISRRQLLASAAVGTVGAAFFGAAPASAKGNDASHGFRLTVLGTTDTHGNVLNWDYFKDAEYDDAQHNDVGLAKISTLVSAMRAERGTAPPCCWTPATPSRAPRWPTTTPGSTRSPAPGHRSTRWPRR